MPEENPSGVAGAVSAAEVEQKRGRLREPPQRHRGDRERNRGNRQRRNRKGLPPITQRRGLQR
jgi:hypothetical protein